MFSVHATTTDVSGTPTGATDYDLSGPGGAILAFAIFALFIRTWWSGYNLKGNE